MVGLREACSYFVALLFAVEAEHQLIEITKVMTDDPGSSHCYRIKTLLSPCADSFLAGKAAWALSGCLTTESADYCMLVNDWVEPDFKPLTGL